MFEFRYREWDDWQRLPEKLVRHKLLRFYADPDGVIGLLRAGVWAAADGGTFRFRPAVTTEAAGSARGPV